MVLGTMICIWQILYQYLSNVVISGSMKKHHTTYVGMVAFNIFMQIEVTQEIRLWYESSWMSLCGWITHLQGEGLNLFL